MSWNGSDPVGAASSSHQKNGDRFHSSTSTSTSSFNYKALIAGLIVVLIGGLSAWLILGRARTPAAPSGQETVKPTRIKEVKPSVVSQKPAPKKHLTECPVL